MSFLFGGNGNGAKAAEQVKTACALMHQWRRAPLEEKDVKKVSDLLAQMKVTLQGTQERDTNPADIDELVRAIVQHDLLLELAEAIHLFPFEARKDAQIIFTCAIRYRPDPNPQTLPLAIDYIVRDRPETVAALCRCYDRKTSIVQCGNMLREALKQEDITILILYDEPPARFDIDRIPDQTPSNGQGLFWQFFQWVEAPSFEISADAFTTFREILTRHKQLVVHWLTVNFDMFFERYSETLMCSQSYVTKRQSIKLLGEILLERTNYPVMTRYVDNAEYLKTCMNLLRDDRKMVQYEGFHVFKVFVANPNKSYPVQKILITNRERLLRFLPNFLAERTDDQQFKDEKMFLIRQIETLSPQPVEPAR